MNAYNPLVVKIGGSILHDNAKLPELCQQLKRLQQAGYSIAIVHGGGFAINQQLNLNNIESTFLDGLRVTSKKAMDVIEMVLCGQINSGLVRALTQVGLNAIGVTGISNKTLFCDYHSVQHGYVGKITEVNSTYLHHIFALGKKAVPVVASVGITADGNAVNINADMAAAHIAAKLKAKNLLFLTDQDGIYNSNKVSYRQLSLEDLSRLSDDKIVTGGMLIKVQAAIMALQAGVESIQICNGKKPELLTGFPTQKSGTWCREYTISSANLASQQGEFYAIQ